jgi:TrmH family RNA methyltransferase
LIPTIFDGAAGDLRHGRFDFRCGGNEKDDDARFAGVEQVVAIGNDKHAKNSKSNRFSPSSQPERPITLEILRSNQNATIRRLIGLRKNRRRRAADVILVDGARETRRAIETGRQLLGFFEQVDAADRPLADGPDWQFVREHAVRANVYRGVVAELFAKVCYGEAGDRCVAEFAATSDSLCDLPELPSGLILILDQVEKPGNIGAVFRTADATGVAAVLLCDCPSDRFNSNAIRGSLGAVFTVPAAVGSQAEIAGFLADQVDEVYSMRVEGSRSLFEADLSASGPRGRIAVILGSEANGLGNRWQTWQKNDVSSGSQSTQQVIGGIHLPMAGQVDSLNVSVSAAVLAFEAVRQRHNPNHSHRRHDRY